MAVIYAIPGFGCTKLLYQNIRVPGHTIKVLSWPEPRKEYTLRDYAKKFIDQIDTSQPFYLMGVSFGGMLCVELSELVHPQKVILISSSKNRNELPWIIRLLKYFPVYRIMSEKMLKRIAMNSYWLIGCPRSFKPYLKIMLEAMPANYCGYCTKYIAGWDRLKNAEKMTHIHGDADRLLWYGGLKDVDHTIAGGTHAMVVFRAGEINALLAKIVNQ